MMPGSGFSSRTLGTPNRSTRDRKSTRLNSSHLVISYAVFCLKKKKKILLRYAAPPARPECHLCDEVALDPYVCLMLHSASRAYAGLHVIAADGLSIQLSCLL